PPERRRTAAPNDVRLLGDRLIVLIQKGHVIVQQDAVDLSLMLLNEPIKRSLPLLVGRTYSHGDAIAHAGAAFLLDEGNHRQFLTGVLDEITGHRPPDRRGIDL